MKMIRSKRLKPAWSSSLLSLFLLLAGISAMAQAASGDDEAALVKKGAYLARLGDCMGCHSVPGRPPFSGGLKIVAAPGVIYTTNITPDKQDGIGNYTEQQFADAVRKGVLPDGTHLYPAMPYPDYTKMTDEDVHALYTYFMKGVKPAAGKTPRVAFGFPSNQRWALSMWNLFLANDERFKPIPGASDLVNRGAYIVEGLGHCGTCHSPRGLGMGEKGYDTRDKDFLSGGNLNGWDVPSLRGLPNRTRKEIVEYLQTGRTGEAAVAGEMKAVVEHSTSHMTEADLNAIAEFIKYLGGDHSGTTAESTTARLTAGTSLTEGERLYLDNCGACHFVTGQGAPKAFPKLDGAALVNAEDPSGLVRIILEGAQMPSTEKAPSMLMMPGFGQRLNDREVAILATFVRQAWYNHASSVSPGEVRSVREFLSSSKE